MVRENLAIVTSFDAFINRENAIFSFLVTAFTLKWREKITRLFFLTTDKWDGLFAAYYFKWNPCLVEMYLGRVLLVTFWRILIIHCVFATKYCEGCSIHSCLTNFRCSRLIRELPCKNLLCWVNGFKGVYLLQIKMFMSPSYAMIYVNLLRGALISSHAFTFNINNRQRRAVSRVQFDTK